MTLRRFALLPALPLCLLAGCGEASRVNPPTEPAEAVTAPAANAPGAAPSGSTAPMLPGAGPTSFVGRWAADVRWCAAPQGANRPIEITPTRFEGYENGCDIATVDETDTGYVATLRCLSEGQTRNERVHMAVSGQTLRLEYLDRGGKPVQLLKCTTLGDTTTRAPDVVPGA